MNHRYKPLLVCAACASASILGVSGMATSVTAETLSEKKATMNTQLDTYQEKLSKLEKEINQTSDEITQAEDESLKVNTELRNARIEHEKDVQAIEDEAKIRYSRNGLQALTELVFAPPVAAFTNHEETVDEIYEERAAALEASEQELKQAEEEAEQMNAKLEELRQLQEQKTKNKKELKKKISAKKKEIAKLKKQIEEEEKARKAELASKQRISGAYARDGKVYHYNQKDLELLYAITCQESNSSYEGALAVITSACNRADSRKWRANGRDPLSQYTARHQYCYSIDSHWKKYLGGNVPAHVKRAVDDCLAGKRNHNFLSFRGYKVRGATKIGGNYYFGRM